MHYDKLRKGLLRNFNAELRDNGFSPFTTDADGERVWNLYLDTFPPAINYMYRTRRYLDCSECHHFVKNYGGLVFVNSALQKRTIWGFQVDDEDVQRVLDTLNDYVLSREITNVFAVTKGQFIGTPINYAPDASGSQSVIKWEHLYLPLMDSYKYGGPKPLNEHLTMVRDNVHVFERSLKHIASEATETVLELINSGSLYRGEEWKNTLEEFCRHQNTYNLLPEDKKPLYAWVYGPKVGGAVARIRNSSIGVLLTDISDGVDLNTAVTSYERITAPSNYKRPKPIFTARMLEDAKRTVMDLGYGESLPRRYATLDDITVNNILFSNRDAARRIQGDVFDELMGSAKTSPKRFDRVEEIPIEKFISDVLPGAREIEAYVENRHLANFVSLIAPVNQEAPSMFKWGNPFSWAYTGNIADSDIRRNVSKAGGKTDGALRFSIQWNDMGSWDKNDLDAHAELRSFGGGLREHIYFHDKYPDYTGGKLDVDIIDPNRGVPAVENIIYPSVERMRNGVYKFYVEKYTDHGGKTGFRAEVAFDGQLYQYNYKDMSQASRVTVAEVTLNKDEGFSIKHYLTPESMPLNVWGIKTMDFVPVSVIMYSPNYWDEQNGIGNKHYMFMLKDCVNSEQPNGFYNEFLNPALEKHRKVFEALGNKMAVAPVDDQLSGLGFSSTLRNELVVKVKGATERVLKIKF